MSAAERWAQHTCCPFRGSFFSDWLSLLCPRRSRISCSPLSPTPAALVCSGAPWGLRGLPVCKLLWPATLRGQVAVSWLLHLHNQLVWFLARLRSIQLWQRKYMTSDAEVMSVRGVGFYKGRGSCNATSQSAPAQRCLGSRSQVCSCQGMTHPSEASGCRLWARPLVVGRPRLVYSVFCRRGRCKHITVQS